MGSRGSRDQLGHVIQSGLVYPVEHNQLRAQVEHLDLAGTKVERFRSRGIASFDDQGQSYVLDAPAGIVHFMDVAVLNHGPGQRQLADSRDITHRLGACVGMHDRLHGVYDPLFDKKPGRSRVP